VAAIAVVKEQWMMLAFGEVVCCRRRLTTTTAVVVAAVQEHHLVEWQVAQKLAVLGPPVLEPDLEFSAVYCVFSVLMLFLVY
jgi:hypothetical protein